MVESQKNNSHLQFIDELRGIAIILVIIVHTSGSIKHLAPLIVDLASFGQMGVQLFFILSAYTLCLSYIRIKDNKKKITFYIRRIFRIVPLYYTGIILYTLLSYILGPSWVSTYQLNYNAKSVIANIFLVHGFYPPATNSVVPGGWSIGTEIAFYAIFPLIFTVYSSVKKVSYLFLHTMVVFISMFCTTDFIARVLHIPVHNDGFIYFNIFNQLPVFLIGMTYYFYVKKNPLKARPHYVNFFFFLLSTSLSIYVFIFHFNVTIIPFLSAFGFIFLMELFRHRKKSNKILTKIGQFSFSIYLFHYLFAWKFSSYLSSILSGKTDPLIIFIGCVIITMACSFPIAYLSWRYIENPGIILGRKLIETNFFVKTKFL